MNDMQHRPSCASSRPLAAGYAARFGWSLPLSRSRSGCGVALRWPTHCACFDNGAPPVEKLTFERRVLDEHGIHLKVRAGGSEPMTIAQVQVDEAYWSFTQDPAGRPRPRCRPLGCTCRIPGCWAKRTRSRSSPRPAPRSSTRSRLLCRRPQAHSRTNCIPQALVGAFVGIVPVAIGMMFYPAMRGSAATALTSCLALTVGLLVFLLVDTMKEALELAGEGRRAFQGHVMVALVALLVVSRAAGRSGAGSGAPTGLALATYIALGIGLHNLGEGLAIGAAFAAGAAGLGTFLVLGFTLHNVTEGIGIAAPMLKSRPSLLTFVGLALLAGAPAILGMWLGSLALTPHWAAFALAIGAGAILQVIVEVSAYVMRSRGGLAQAMSPALMSGLALGIGVMYVTALLVKV